MAPGIPEDIFDRIFFSDDQWKKQRETGLGLSISQSAIDIHQGLISCENKINENYFFIFTYLWINNMKTYCLDRLMMTNPFRWGNGESSLKGGYAS